LENFTMKLNPFQKKTSAYYAKTKAAHDQLASELQALQTKLSEAQADAQQKQQRLRDQQQYSSIYSSLTSEKRASIEANEAQDLVGSLKGQILSLEGRIAPLARIVQAPKQFARAKEELERVRQQQRTLTVDRSKTQAQMDQLSQRAAEVDIRLAAELKTASEALISAQEDFTPAPALTQLETQQRVISTSLAQLQDKLRGMDASWMALPKALNDAERIFVSCRAVMLEIELYEQLMPVMGLLAKASVSRQQDIYSHDPSHFDIDVGLDLLESATAELEGELQAA